MLLQVQRVSTVISQTETQWEKVIESFKKCDSSAGSGSDSEKKKCGKLNRQTWSSRHQKHVETAIEQYTRCSDAQRVIEQNDSLI